ncbi:quinone oxidoreductase family protein [Oceanobacter mangrovi]|uniref:quinone oxidoreductase family protein n=1 Tax=Oceanobacter mangrovi TaxID=2862510 RepID=UPI001C8E9669|nr:zinc-binding alcohol dehydrogenase family protein [Oceanobacter mangrovi]
MKTLRFSEYGQADVLHIEETAKPVPATGEVLIKIAAAAINPSDVKNVAGLFSARLPMTPGRDFAGTVESAGPWYGKQVWGSGAGFGISSDGAQREYITMPASWLSEKPAKLTMAEAATVGVPYVTAWATLMLAGQLQADETLLVNGCTGAVGRAAIQLAHWKGARVIGIGRSDQPCAADVYINAREQDVVAGVKAATDGLGADIALDAVGGNSFETVLKCLRRGGRQLAITSTGTAQVSFNLLDFYHQQLQLIGVDTMKLTGTDIAAILDELRYGFDSGALQPQSHHSWNLANAQQAYATVSSGKNRQKQILLCQ